MGIILRLLSSFINIYELAILVECLLSWIVQYNNNEFMNILRTITTPVLEPFRKLQYKYFDGLPIDFSPILAVMALELLERIIYIIL